MRARVEALQPVLLGQLEQVLKAQRLSHAYLFSGDFGSYALALYLAQSRFCQDKQEAALPCGVCRPCRLIEQGDFADVIVVEPSGQTIKTDQIRRLVTDFAQSGFEQANQVFIIKGAERMHPNAANSLLKQIEEPNSSYYVFLIASDESKVLPTIKSRCQLLTCRPNRSYLMRQFEEGGLLPDQAKLLSQLVTDEGQVAQVLDNKKLPDLFRTSRQFLKQLVTRPDEAYLLASQLAVQASDKADQELLLELLLLQAGKDLAAHPENLPVLVGLEEARRFWQANVSLQNSLEHLVLRVERKA